MPQIYHVGNYLGDATPGHKIYNEYGTAMTDRSRLEFTGEGVEVTDDAVNGKTVVSISGGGGGGIPLANPTNISIINQDEAAAICWTDPPNIIIDMETIATWAGTLVVRKAGAAPQSKTDGVIVVDSRVRDQYASTGFVDTGLTNGVTYYYGIFPYTTKNVYNYNSVTQFSPAAIYPTAVSDLAASGGNAQATVTWTTPADASSVNIVVSATGEADRTFTAATSPLTVTGLTNDTTYTVKAVSVNTKGRTTESAGVTVTPQAGITVTVTLYSAASDTVSFTDINGSQTVTTDSTGKAQNVTILANPSKPITFISSVANDPNNIQANYSKSITITSSTTEVYVMPDKVVYWYGYKTATLSSNPGTQTTVVFNQNTNSVEYGFTSAKTGTAPTLSFNQASAINNTSAVNMIYSSTFTTGRGRLNIVAQTEDKSIYYQPSGASTIDKTLFNASISASTINTTGVRPDTAGVGEYNRTYVYAIWYD